MRKKLNFLINKGVKIENPENTIIGEEVDLDNIESGSSLNNGSIIKGENTYISKGSIIGSEGPVTLENTFIDENVKLGSGYFNKSVFLKDVKTGSNSHVREGTILEEKSSIAHTAGLKQTILFPYATLGSLVNFCDCMMTGGTSSKNHSEVGSSFIHFNFTPNQDKATPSLMGNVYEGVFLNKDPVFLGGQGGMVGPVRIGFGNVSAAGSIIRSDENRNNRLIFENVHKNFNINKNFGLYSSINRVLKNNLFYMGNLIALKNWYIFVKKDFLNSHIYKGLIKTINSGINERVKRLLQLKEKVEIGINILEKKEKETKLLILKKNFFDNSNILIDLINETSENTNLYGEKRGQFLTELNKNKKSDYLDTIKGLDENSVEIGTDWLKSIVDNLIIKSSEIITQYELRD